MPSAGLARRYWDSFCFLALLNDDEGADDCEKILDEAKEEKTIIGVSPLVQVEVVRPRSSPRPIPKEDAEKVRAFFENDYFKWRIIDRKIADMARELCWEHNVHPRDAIHFAAAIDTSCDFLETTDNRLLQVDGQVKGSALKIVKPHWTGQPELFKATNKD